MPTYFVTGATGQQGGAVAYALLKSGHKVNALVRNLTSASSLALQSAGAALFLGTFTDIPSLTLAATGTSGVFINVTPSHKAGEELQHAKNIITASLSAGVQHIIYSSVVKTGQHDKFPDFDPGSSMGAYWLSKHAIENAVRESGVCWTILRPGYFMTNFFPPLSNVMYPELWSEGVFKHGYEVGTRLSLIDPRDIGIAGAKAFEEPEKWESKEVDLVAEEKTVEAMVDIFGKIIGRKIEVLEIKDDGVEGGWLRQNIVKAQKALSRINKSGLPRGDLETARALGVEFRDFTAFLEDKKKRGELKPLEIE